MNTERLTHPEAQEEVKEALICFLRDNAKMWKDASKMEPDKPTLHYSQEALKDALVVIMDAFGFQIVDENH